MRRLLITLFIFLITLHLIAENEPIVVGAWEINTYSVVSMISLFPGWLLGDVPRLTVATNIPIEPINIETSPIESKLIIELQFVDADVVMVTWGDGQSSLMFYYQFFDADTTIAGKAVQGSMLYAYGKEWRVFVFLQPSEDEYIVSYTNIPIADKEFYRVYYQGSMIRSE